ncbi:MAG: ATPase [Prevotella sp.]|nr:ATPase [Prevotella sp.]
MTLIADSGSTKTDWLVINDSGSTKTDWLIGEERIKTQGINPILQDDDTILAILSSLTAQHSTLNSQHSTLNFHLSTLNSQHSTLNTHLSTLNSQLLTLNVIRFYGAGVRPEQEERMQRLLSQVFPSATSIDAKSDMLGAARALCGKEQGLACILGTGANSCLFDGEHIIQNIPPMGYILGDEGSGAVMGRMFLNALYKERLYAGARQEFEQFFNLTMTDVIARVYRQPMANRWLASLCPYIHEHLSHSSVEEVVIENFRLFIRHNLVPYHRPHLPINAVGSVAFFFKPQLEQAAAAEGYTVGHILRSPLDAAENL